MQKWIKWGDYAMRTKHHSVAKFKVNGKWIYALYEIEGAEVIKKQIFIKFYNSFEEAKNAAGN